MFAKIYKVRADWHRLGGDNIAACALYEKALKVSKASVESPTTDFVALLEALGRTYARLRRFTDAVSAIQRAIDAQDRLEGAGSWPASVLHMFIGEIELSELRNPYAAIDHFRKALDIRERSLPNHPDTAMSAYLLASTYEATWQAPEAIDAYERAIRILNTVREPSHPDRLSVNGALAQYYVAIGFYHLAHQLADSTIEAMDDSRPDISPTLVIGLLNTLAVALVHKSDFRRAIYYCQSALDLCSKAPRSSHLKAQVLRNQAQALAGIAEYDKAQDAAEKALTIQRHELGDTEPNTIAATLVTLAYCLHCVGRIDRSITLLTEAIDLCKKAGGESHPETAFAIASLAEAYRSLGNLDLALSQYEFVSSIYHDILGPRHPISVMSRISLAGVLCDADRFEDAVQVCEEALGALDARLGVDHHFMAAALNTYAVALSGLGRNSDAITKFEESLQIRKRMVGSGHPDYAICQANLALALQRVGRIDAAKILFEGALSTLTSNLGSKHPSTVECSARLAFVLHGQGKMPAAIWRLKQDVNALQEHRYLISAIGKGELASYTQKVSGIYQILASWLVEDGRFPDALQVLDLLKESEYFEFIRRSAATDPRTGRVPLNSDETSWVSHYDKIANDLARAGAAIHEYLLTSFSKGEIRGDSVLEALEVERAKAESNFRAFLASMDAADVSLATGSAAISTESLHLSDKKQAMVALLGPSVALVSYYLLNDRVGILLTTESDQVSHEIPVDAKILKRLAYSFWSSLSQDGVDVLPAAQSLYSLLFEPIESTLQQKSKDTIMLSLDGVLRYIPFSALHDGNGYLVERMRFTSYSISSQATITSPAAVEWHAAGFGASKSSGSHEPLPYVVDELKSIIGRNGVGIVPGDIYLDESFTKENLQNATMGKYNITHIASHFEFGKGGTEEESYLLLGDGSCLTLRELREGHWNFGALDLLTLSACETGLGGSWNRNGKEIDGLASIAHYKGAKGVLATLWKIADQSTPVIMQRFYEAHQNEHLGKLDALRASQLAMLRSPYAHPFHWAAFILIGNWM